jgi:hypothetical protein
MATTLDAFARQTDLEGDFLNPTNFEVLLLMNNCTDGSANKAVEWAADNPEIALHIVEREFAGESAHVGTARRWLMDTAWHRLTNRQSKRDPVSAILSTDSDTTVRPDWIVQNLKALEDGSDAVGGVIFLKEDELQTLPPGARRAYRDDRTYQSLVARLEDMLDPQDGDPWPRHLEHFGASLACTPEAYAKAGGMPDVQPLEDVAFVNRLRRHGARLRHAPPVGVFTSARFDGKAQIGLSFQLRKWQALSDRNEPHLVPSARWLIHRFETMSKLRQLYRTGGTFSNCNISPRAAHEILLACTQSSTIEDFLAAINCDRMIEDSFPFEREQPISAANREIRAAIHRRSAAAAGPSVLVTSL